MAFPPTVLRVLHEPRRVKACTYCGQAIEWATVPADGRRPVRTIPIIANPFILHVDREGPVAYAVIAANSRHICKKRPKTVQTDPRGSLWR